MVQILKGDSLLGEEEVCAVDEQVGDAWLD